jgi:TolA-binding protein
MKQEVNQIMPNAKELRLFREGKLSASRMKEITAMAKSDPFLAEAIEGYAAVPGAFEALPAFSSVVGTTGIFSAVAASSPWWHLNGWIIGVAVGGTMATAVVLVTKEDPKTVVIQATPASSTSPSLGAEDQTTNSTSPATLENAALSNNTASYTDASQTTQAVQNSTHNDSINKIQPHTNVTTFTNSNGETIIAHAPKVIPPKDIKAVQIAHILNYKIADYTDLRYDNWPANDNGSLPANLENRFQQSVEKELIFIGIPYLEYVTGCLEAYDAKNFGEAMRQFKIILNQFPDDVNGLFYTAMSNYYAGNYEAAITYFQKVNRNPIRSFREEANFYEAKSLKALGRIDEAKVMFQKIVDIQGFYADQAYKEMK